MMNSCLYEARVMHVRLRPKEHRLNHRVFMFYLDLDEVEMLSARFAWIGKNRRAIYSLWDRDHLQDDGRDIRQKIRDFVRSRGMSLPVARIMLLTNLRTFGYLFNPVSFYYCFDATGRPLCAVAEVGNTFGEIKLYYLGPESLTERGFVMRIGKFYYISPFVDLDVSMEFRLPVPGEDLYAQVDDYDSAGKFLCANIAGSRKPISGGNLWKMTCLYPWITMKVIGLIHGHALLLFLKKIPYHLKESNPHLQKEVLRGWRKNGVSTTHSV